MGNILSYIIESSLDIVFGLCYWIISFIVYYYYYIKDRQFRRISNFLYYDYPLRANSFKTIQLYKHMRYRNLLSTNYYFVRGNSYGSCGLVSDNKLVFTISVCACCWALSIHDIKK